MRSLLSVLLVLAVVMAAVPTASANVVINELVIQPGSAGEVLPGDSMEWVELFNDGPASQDVGGWVLTDREAITRATLPAWIVPEGAYLTVHFGDSIDDSDFSDGEGHYYVGDVPEYFDTENGECGLYNGSPSSGTIVDFVAWGHFMDYSSGMASSHAVSAGIWVGGQFVATDTLNTVDHLGRAFDGFDTDVPGDFVIHKWQWMFQRGSQQPSNPIQQSPSDNKVITETMPTFDWFDVESVESYRLQVIPDTSYSSPIIDIDGLEDSEYTPVSPLSSDIYTWRVAGEVGGDSSRWSREWLLFVDDGSWVVSEQGGRGRAICPFLFQRKDSKLLCIWFNSRPGCPEIGIPTWCGFDSWDSPLPNNLWSVQRQCHGNNYCVRASIAMINHHLGGDLTQDRISYYLFHELQNKYPGPEGDLGHGFPVAAPMIDSSQAKGLSWALNNATIDVRAKPTMQPSFSYDSIKTWIDQLDCFMARTSGHMMVIDAYALLTQGNCSTKVIYVNDSNVGYDTLVYSASTGFATQQGMGTNFEHVFLHPQGWSSYRTLEASCTTDTDGDGVMDFDEENRFFTSINSMDSDSDGVNDKQEIRSYTFHGTDHPTCPVWNAFNPFFPDIDGDSLRAELDSDTDNDSLSDGAEDIDGDGISPEPGETCVYDSLNRITAVMALVVSTDGGNAVLAWPPVVTASSYAVYGDTIPFSTGELLEIVVDTTWTDFGAASTRPTPYFYCVTAIE